MAQSNALVPQQHQRLGNVTVEDARLLFRNFAGEEGPYNAKGERSFAVALDPETAAQMKAAGWNVKSRPPREEGDEELNYISVAVKYGNRPPIIVMVTMRYNRETQDFEPAKTTLPEELVELVDSLDIAKADLILNPYRWTMNGKSGVKAYLKSLYITVQQDELEVKYAAVPELDMRGRPLEIAAAAYDDGSFDPDEIVIEEEDIEVQD